MKIFIVMCFVEPVAVCLFAICYSNVYVHLLFAKIILLDTIYLPKFLRSCFYSIIHTLKYYIFVKINVATYCGKSCLIFKVFQFEMKHENIKPSEHFSSVSFLMIYQNSAIHIK